MSLNAETTVMIADDHHIFRHGLEDLLSGEGFNVTATAANGQDAIRLARQHSPAVAVLDMSMPLLNGIDTAREIQKQSPGTRCILLTMHADESYAIDALRAGMRGYVLKEQAAFDLINAIREIMAGAVYISPRISGPVLGALMANQQPPGDSLTGREKQVLQLIAEGNTTKEIASLLNLSVKTAESHRTHIMQRLNMHNIASLVRYAIRRGMIKA